MHPSYIYIHIDNTIIDINIKHWIRSLSIVGQHTEYICVQPHPSSSNDVCIDGYDQQKKKIWEKCIVVSQT